MLVGHQTRDDAGVFAISADLAMVQSIDVFGPVVDEPFAYGQIAAANALSDLYAMGVAPSTAVAFAAFPDDESLPDSVLGDILCGGASKVTEAGAVLLGGHSIRDHEPKYGLCVTGFAHPDRILTNAGCRPGDSLILTKPIGSGILGSALKRGMLDEGTVARVTGVMAALNRVASETAVEVGVHAMTDVTGFGLLGHLSELCDASGVHASIVASRIPLIEGVRAALQHGVPGGSKRNLKQAKRHTEFADAVGAETRLLLADAQTSGGLLISVAADREGELLDTLHARGVYDAACIGRVQPLGTGPAMIRVQ